MEIYIYKLKYQNQEEGISDFLEKGVYIQQTNEEGELVNVNSEDIIAIVPNIEIVLEEAIFNEEGDVIKDMVVEEGFHVDIMSKKEINFGDKEMFPRNPKHRFAGH